MSFDNLLPTTNCKAPFNAVLDCVRTEPDAEPVTLDEAKQWMRVDLDDDDALITSLITVSRQLCEDYLNISLCTRTVTATIRNDNGNIYLPYGPVVLTDGVFTPTIFTDALGNAITEYRFNGIEFPSLVFPTYGVMVIKYDVGYTTLPAKFKTAILQQLAYIYENRGDVSADANLLPIVKMTLKPLRRV